MDAQRKVRIRLVRSGDGGAAAWVEQSAEPLPARVPRRDDQRSSGRRDMHRMAESEGQRGSTSTSNGGGGETSRRRASSLLRGGTRRTSSKVRFEDLVAPKNDVKDKRAKSSSRGQRRSRSVGRVRRDGESDMRRTPPENIERHWMGTARSGPKSNSDVMTRHSLRGSSAQVKSYGVEKGDKARKMLPRPGGDVALTRPKSPNGPSTSSAAEDKKEATACEAKPSSKHNTHRRHSLSSAQGPTQGALAEDLLNGLRDTSRARATAKVMDKTVGSASLQSNEGKLYTSLGASVPAKAKESGRCSPRTSESRPAPKLKKKSSKKKESGCVASPPDSIGISNASSCGDVEAKQSGKLSPRMSRPLPKHRMHRRHSLSSVPEVPPDKMLARQRPPLSLTSSLRSSSPASPQTPLDESQGRPRAPKTAVDEADALIGYMHRRYSNTSLSRSSSSGGSSVGIRINQSKPLKLPRNGSTPALPSLPLPTHGLDAANSALRDTSDLTLAAELRDPSNSKSMHAKLHKAVAILRATHVPYSAKEDKGRDDDNTGRKKKAVYNAYCAKEVKDSPANGSTNSAGFLRSSSSPCDHDDSSASVGLCFDEDSSRGWGTKLDEDDWNDAMAWNRLKLPSLDASRVKTPSTVSNSSFGSLSDDDMLHCFPRVQFADDISYVHSLAAVSASDDTVVVRHNAMSQMKMRQFYNPRRQKSMI